MTPTSERQLRCPCGLMRPFTQEQCECGLGSVSWFDLAKVQTGFEKEFKESDRETK